MPDANQIVIKFVFSFRLQLEGISKENNANTVPQI